MCSPDQPPRYVYLIKSGSFSVEKETDSGQNMIAEGATARLVEMRSLKLFANKFSSKVIKLSIIEENDFVGEEIIGSKDAKYEFKVVCESHSAKALRFAIELFMWLPRPILRSVQQLFEAKLSLRMRCYRNSLFSETRGPETWAEATTAKGKVGGQLASENAIVSPVPIEIRHFAKSTRATYEKGDFKNQKLLRSVIDSHQPTNIPSFEEEYRQESYFDYRRTHRKARDGKLRLITLKNCKRAIENSKKNIEREKLNENCK